MTKLDLPCWTSRLSMCSVAPPICHCGHNLVLRYLAVISPAIIRLNDSSASINDQPSWSMAATFPSLPPCLPLFLLFSSCSSSCSSVLLPFLFPSYSPYSSFHLPLLFQPSLPTTPFLPSPSLPPTSSHSSSSSSYFF